MQNDDKTTDPVRPAHYKIGGVSPIDAIEAWGLGFSLGNAVKYIARHAHKDAPVDDLRKAAWYIEREIARMGGVAVPAATKSAKVLFLDAWSAAKGEPGYDKSKWQEARALLGFP